MLTLSNSTLRTRAASALALVASFGLLTGCDASGPEAVGQTAFQLTTTTPAAATTADEAAEAASLSELARTFAVALGSSPAVRNEVRRDLADSRYTAEHKLHLQSHLAAQAAEGKGKLLAAMAKETGRTESEVISLASSVRELEFYLPVADHRARWRGGKDMLVAALLDDEDEAPVGFGLDGRSVTLSAEAPPDTPVLSVVPVETDFTQPLPASVTNTGDAGGAAIGTYAVDRAKATGAFGPGPIGTTSFEDPCDDPNAILPPECGGGSGSGGGGSVSPGLYYTAANLAFVGEAWVRGQPEIEVHTRLSYVNQNGSRTVYEESCAAAAYTDMFSGSRRFDQNDENWTGRALVVSEDEFNSIGNSSGNTRGVEVTLWEDDTDRCAIVTNDNDQWQTNAILAGSTAVLFGLQTSNDNLGIFSIVTGIASIAAGLYDTIYDGQDEYLGKIELQESTLGDFSPVFYRNENGRQRNGTAKLELVN